MPVIFKYLPKLHTSVDETADAKDCKEIFRYVLIKIEDVKATNCAESKVETSIIAAGWRMIGWLG